MRLGINTLFQASGGSLTNLGLLLRSWDESGVLAKHEVTIFTSPRVAERLKKAAGETAVAKTTVVLFPGSDRGLASRLIDEQFRLPRALTKRAIDVLFCPGNVVPYFARVPVVPTFQNAAPFCESVTRTATGIRHWLQFRLLGLFMRMSARKASAVIFLSRWLRDLFVRRFGFDRDRGHVIPRAGHEAVSPDAALEERLGVRRPFLISVAHLNPYKQIVELIEGFAIARRDVPGWQLVLVGMAQFPAYRQRIAQTIERHALHDSVVFTGELSHREALTLMAGSESFVFTSTCEAGPTALIEALTLSLPIAASNVGAMPEVSGEAALLFDPYDPEAIGGVLRRLMRDPRLRADLRQRAAEGARRHLDAAQVAAATLAVLEAAAK